jgi:hypothetical protein
MTRTLLSRTPDLEGSLRNGVRRLGLGVGCHRVPTGDHRREAVRDEHPVGTREGSLRAGVAETWSRYQDPRRRIPAQAALSR